MAGTQTDGHVLVWRSSSGIYNHEAPTSLVDAATETAAGKVEHATEAEVQAGTSGNLVASAARLKAELDRRLTLPAWIAPTLLNGWVNFPGPGREVAGYRKTPWGEVQLKGAIKDGSIATDTVLFNLPAGYRPAAIRSFVALNGGNSVCRIQVLTGGNVQVDGATSATFLNLENVRFDV